MAGRLRITDLIRLLASWAVATLALMIAAAVIGGIEVTTRWAFVAVAAVAGVLGLVLRPLLVEVSARVGWLAVIPVALTAQAVVMHAAMTWVPGITASFWSAFFASWIAAGVGTLIGYATTAGTDDGLTTALARRGRLAKAVDDPHVDGVLFVQLDGVPFPVLQWAVQSGAVPTIRRWLSSGDYVLREWVPQLPCTTPASQLGLLHGTVDRVPAFRWYDRELGRVLVANRPADAEVIEQRASNGLGLLCDGGVSVSNLFTGDAPRALLTMSSVELQRGSTQTRRAVAWFLATPSGFTRSVNRTFAELFKERWQANRQVRRDLEPRMRRDWSFAALRAVTNGLLCDLNTAIVAEELRHGTKSVYVDYVDYDEIAHHAGMFRPESLAALDGLDRTLATLEKLAALAPRRYRIVALSDHGQSQGRSFEDRYGFDLGQLCEELMTTHVHTMDAAVEGWGRAESIASDLGTDGLAGRLATRTHGRVTDEYDAQPVAPDEPIVLGSGNLGLLYVPGPERLSLDELARRWPRLVKGLAAHPGIGFVAGVDEAGVPWAVGAEGFVNLDSGAVNGVDPLEPFGAAAARLLRRAVLMTEAPDLYVNSALDPHTNDVAAFEHLVGAHGGLGGWQDSAVLLAPTDLATHLPDRIEGADELHRLLVGMLEQCGHRQGSRV